MRAKRVLLVDDDATTLLAIGGLLRRELYEVTTCAESAMGVSLALRSAWDLIVLDLDFGRPRPEMTGSFDGLTLLRWMRTAGRNTPVILLTGSEDGGLDRRAESAGATRVLRKSDSPGKILEAARHALEPTESRVANEVVEEVHQPVTPAAVSVKNLGWLASAMARVRSALNLFC